MSDSKTDRNVYILGAGFSADANAPLLYNFLDKSRELLDDPESGLDGHERDEFRSVFEFRRKMSQAREKVKLDLDNIDQLFGLVEMQQRLGLGASDARSATVYLIAKTLQLMIERGGRRHEILFSAHPSATDSIAALRELNLPLQSQYDPPKSSLDIYDFFAMLIGGRFDSQEKRANRKDVVITFNYDLVLDHALMRAGIPISYHLPPESVSIPAANNKEGFALLKLHGSTNWGICGKCKGHITVSFDKMTSSPRIFRSMECRECQKKAFQPMLVPPSWDKTEYQSLMRPVWNRAVTELQKATRICIIGYSLPESDAYFKYLLTLGLAENHNLYKFIVVDLAPHPARFAGEEQQETRRQITLRERYEGLLEDLFQERRFIFHNEGFWQWTQGGSMLQELGRGGMIIRG
jgi:hypothetical protein